MTLVIVNIIGIVRVLTKMISLRLLLKMLLDT